MFPQMILFFGNLVLFYTIGNGLILEDESSNSEIGVSSTDGVINFSPEFLLDFIIMLGISTIILYLMIIKFKQRGLRVLFSFSLFFIYLTSIYELIFIASDSITDATLISVILIFILSFLIPVTFYFMYVFIFGIYKLWIRNLGLVVSGLLAGRLIAIYLDFTSLVVISIILIFYDIWNVFKGPLTRLIGKPSRKNHVLVENQVSSNFEAYLNQICSEGTPVYISQNSNVIIGLGDLFFFSALMYRAMMVWDLVGILASFVAIIFGLILTLKILTYISPLPGLPIPVSLTLLSFLILDIFG